MSQRNQHLTHAMLRKSATTTPKQFQTTWCFGKDWRHAGGAGDLQSATVFPGILPFRYTCKSIAFWKSCAIFGKKRSLQQSHFRGRKHIGFLDSKKWSSPVPRLEISIEDMVKQYECYVHRTLLESMLEGCSVQSSIDTAKEVAWDFIITFPRNPDRPQPPPREWRMD